MRQSRVSSVLREFEYYCIFVSAVALIGIAVISGIAAATGYEFSLIDGGCTYYEQTGYDCLGCGATRALNAWIHGDFISSLQFNVIVIFTVTSLAVYVASAVMSSFSVKVAFRVRHLLIVFVQVSTVLFNRVKNTERVALDSSPFRILLTVLCLVMVVAFVFIYLGNAEVCELCTVGEISIGLIGACIENGTPNLFCIGNLMLFSVPVVLLYLALRRYAE